MSHRLPDSLYDLVLQHVDAALTACYELMQYGLLLQSSHFQASALLTTGSSRMNLDKVKEDILKKMQQEWMMVLRMESAASTNELLARHCGYTVWQVYRETMTVAELENFTLSSKLTDFLAAWHPAVQGSCNVEDVFADLQDAIQRSGKSDTGSLSNLAAVAIRSCSRKCSAAELPTTSLLSADYEGTSVRSLKTSVFRPESCSSSSPVNNPRLLHVTLLHPYIIHQVIYTSEKHLWCAS